VGGRKLGRLGLQTLINTYPDSEFLAKAKLGIADSYYKESGTANMAASHPGLQGFHHLLSLSCQRPLTRSCRWPNAHYQQMAKPDRDRSEAKLAEDEYQTFLSKYPKDPTGAPRQSSICAMCRKSSRKAITGIAYFYYVKRGQASGSGRE